MRVELQGRAIPRNEKGDPKFKDLPQLQTVFSDDEITELVNRSLYQIEYQKNSHTKRQALQTALEMPLKRAFKKLFPHDGYTKATEDQIKQAMAYLREHPELAREDYGTH